MFSVDNIAPVFSNCPSDINQVATFGSSTMFVQWTAPTATDNSGAQPIVVNLSQNPGQFTVGTTTITYRATDGTGNFAICAFDIIVTPGGRLDNYFSIQFNS